MTTFEAIGIAEGFVENDDPEREVAAWQYLIDTGLAWQMQGWFGRVARQLIENGTCKPPQPAEEPPI